MTLQESIGALLREECPLIAAVVSGRIFWGRPPENRTFPLVVFRRSGEREAVASMDWGRSGVISMTFEFLCLSRTSQAEAAEVESAVLRSLTGENGMCWTGRTPSTDGEWWVQGIRRIAAEDMSSEELTEAGVYGVAQAFEVIARPYTG